MKRGRVLAGMLPAAMAGVAVPGMAAGHAAQPLQAASGGRAKTVSMHPLGGRPLQQRLQPQSSTSSISPGAVLSAFSCSQDVCIDLHGHGIFVSKVREAVFYAGNYTRVWALHYYGIVQQSKALTFGTGWHHHSWTVNHNLRNHTQVCVGASRTPGFPCVSVHI